MLNTEKDVTIKLGLVWYVLNVKMSTIWESKLYKEVKVTFFRAVVENLLVCRVDCWSMTKDLKMQLNKTFIEILRNVKKTSWSKHLPVTVLYKDKLQLSDIIRKSRLKLVRNYWSSKSEILSPFSVARISAWNTEPW